MLKSLPIAAAWLPRRRLRYLRPAIALALMEVVGWSLLVRLLLVTLATERTLRVLDALPRRRRALASVGPPPEQWCALAGACLGRSLVRSQYLRVRGQPSELVIGVRGGLDGFAAHAWLAGDPVASDFVEIRRVAR